jgi:hypothetical protein
MRTILAVVVLIAMTAGSAAYAVEKQNAPGGAANVKPPLTLSPGSAAPLTQNECLALGGETSNLKSCVTGMMCTTKTVDSKGVVTEHSQCVTKAE